MFHDESISINFSTDNLFFGIWEKINTIEEDSQLKRSALGVPLLIQSAYADSTLLKYRQGWRKWLTWCESKPEVKHCPADTFFVAVYFNELLVDNCKLGALVSAYCGIRWGHIQAGLIPPTDHPFVKLAFEGAKRLVTHRESNQKESISR